MLSLPVGSRRRARRLLVATLFVLAALYVLVLFSLRLGLVFRHKSRSLADDAVIKAYHQSIPSTIMHTGRA
jgi:hypothetical protein